MTAKEQNKLVGIFLMVHGGIQALVMVLMVLIYGGLGIGILSTARRDDDQIAGGIMLGFALVFGFVFLLFIIPQLIGGWKIMKEKPGARTWGIVASIVACLSFPLGTAAGVYGLVFLLGEEGKKFYLNGANQFAQNSFQPPPHNWQ